MYQTIVLITFLIINTAVIAQENFLLSGQIKASDNQSFYAPKSNSWQVQVQWILPEGDIAQEGDLVVVFDSGSIQSDIEQGSVSLISAQEELHRINTTTEQSLLESTYAEKRSALVLEKARIDASIGVDHLSRYDHEKNQLEFEKAIIANTKSKEALKQTILKNQVSIATQKIKITKHQDKLTYNQNKLALMSLKAKRTGPVLYGNSPWTGEKIYVGITAQPGWKIVEIPSLNGMYIEAWVHEVDYKHLVLGTTASLIFDAFPQQPLMAKLSEISTQPEERKEWGNDVYFRTHFQFNNDTELNLLPGMSAQLEFTGVNNDK